jgi:hypothetical protein
VKRLLCLIGIHKWWFHLEGYERLYRECYRCRERQLRHWAGPAWSSDSWWEAAPTRKEG